VKKIILDPLMVENDCPMGTGCERIVFGRVEQLIIVLKTDKLRPRYLFVCEILFSFEVVAGTCFGLNFT